MKCPPIGYASKKNEDEKSNVDFVDGKLKQAKRKKSD